METPINKAKYLAKEGKINWASPLIHSLETQLKHSAIMWVQQVIKEVIEEHNPQNRNNYLSWLSELEEIIKEEQYSDIQYLQDKGRLIFNPPRGRDIYAVLISRLYGAEGYYRLNKYELYIRFLWDILDQINEKFSNDQSLKYLSIIEKFPDVDNI